MANAGYRQIHPEFWDDPFILKLSPDEKLLFIYMFSNGRTSLSGLYEISILQISFHTGLSPEFIEQALDKFQKAGKIVREDDIYFVVNLFKRHFSKSPKVLVRVKNDIENIPECEPKRVCIQKYQERIEYAYSIDTQTHEDEDVVKDEDEDVINPTAFSNLSVAFVNTSGLPELSGGVRKYTESINKMVELGVTPKDLETAIRELREKNYNIIGPGSCINAALNVMGKRKGVKGTYKGREFIPQEVLSDRAN